MGAKHGPPIMYKGGNAPQLLVQAFTAGDLLINKKYFIFVFCKDSVMDTVGML